MTVFVGGVGELYQGDLDLGRHAAERLAAEDLGHYVIVEDLHYGAIAVVQRLEEVAPEALVLIGATARGRAPGAVERRRLRPLALSTADARIAVESAGTGYVTIDLVVEVASALGALPERTVAIEVEPARIALSEEPSPEAAAALEEALALVRDEVARIPVLALADQIRDSLDDRLERTPAVDALEVLLAALHGLDEHGRWGDTFRARDALRASIAQAQTGEGMDHRDWGMWWGLIEALDRLQSLDASAGSSSPRL